MNFRVPEQKSPVRLDKFLIGRFPRTSRSFWRNHLREWVRVNGKVPAKGFLLRGGENLFLKAIPPEKPIPLKPNPDIHLNCLYEDDHLFAIDKPAGLPCLPLGEGDRETVMNGILAKFPEQAGLDPAGWEGGMIHRLDNETSGLLLFAKTPEAKRRLSKLNHDGKIQKEYLAWVSGNPPERGVILKPIAHHPKNPRRMVVAEEPGEAKRLKARTARTQFEVLKRTPRHCLLRIGIHRGARHQIRVHLAWLGFPVVGDSLYGTDRPKGMNRHLLHASRVFFSHPVHGRKMEINSPAPQDFHP